MKVLVLGSGLAGLAAGLALGRRGHAVTLVERDPTPAPLGAEAAFDAWQRPGIPQFRQPHNFLGLGRRILRERAPDVYQAVLQAGASEIEQFRFITDGSHERGDEDLVTLACRRPVFEAVLRRAVAQQANIDMRLGCRVGGLALSAGQAPHVEGVVLENGERLMADLVVDASGRASRAPAWLQEHGADPVSERTSKCGLMYYSVHFRVRPGATMPPYASVLAGPRGDLGYVAYAIFVGDNATFCLCIMPPPWDRKLRALRDLDAFMRVAERLPGVGTWVDPDVAWPITPVIPMGQLSNTLRRFIPNGTPVAPGLQPIGDALSHTNPTFAFGASLSLHHAFTLADVLEHAADHYEIAQRFHDLVGEDAERRYYAVASEDRDRARCWGGELIDLTNPDESMPLFLRSVVYRVAAADPAILRAVVRRIDLLDPVDRLERQETLLERALDIYRDMQASRALRAGPTRDELLEALAGAQKHVASVAGAC
jgi:2-polyprenyl-6-methoxyphenol hydroxylase-like FAD-dependent oxidoreductase